LRLGARLVGESYQAVPPRKLVQRGIVRRT